MRIAVVDGQGGGIGKSLVDSLRKSLPEEIEIIALGTNAVATSLMMKAGANDGASGEAAIVYNASRVDIIVGTISIILANALLGEVTPAMAKAISDSPADKILLPMSRSNVEIVGCAKDTLPRLVEKTVAIVNNVIGRKHYV